MNCRKCGLLQGTNYANWDSLNNLHRDCSLRITEEIQPYQFKIQMLESTVSSLTARLQVLEDAATGVCAECGAKTIADYLCNKCRAQTDAHG